MKTGPIILAFVAGITLGVWGGTFWAKTAILAGPYSDNYGPALSAIGEAKARLQAGNTNIVVELQTAEEQIEQAQYWTRRFLGLQSDGTNAAAPRRSP